MKYSAALCFPHLEGETHLTSPKSMTFLFIPGGVLGSRKQDGNVNCGSVHNHKTISYYDTLLTGNRSKPQSIKPLFPT